MELQFSSFVILFTFLPFILIVLKIGRKPKPNDSASNLPPGPRKLPLVGNMHQFISSLPHHALRDLAKKYGPIMHLRLGEVSTIVVSTPETAREVLKTHDAIFASRPPILATTIMSYNSTDIAFAPYGEYWRQLRKICVSELLSTKRVQSFRSIREEEMGNLIKWISSRVGSSINLTEKINSSTYGVTSQAAFGETCEEHEKFISAVKESIKLSEGFNIADAFPSFKLLHVISGIRPKFERLHREVDRILENIISEHKMATKSRDGKIGEDLVDVLIKFEGNNGLEFSLTTDNIKAVLLDVFSAGSDTSATTVDWAMAEMMKNPRVMKKAQAEVRQVFDRRGIVNEDGIPELKYLKLVIKETLRLHPVAPLLLPRECGEKCEINGYEIPVKTKVIVNAWAIGRDPRYWNEADRFYPERFIDSPIEYKGTDFEYIPFGAGRRICPGMTFGLANVEFPLAMLLYHFDWKLPGGLKNEDLDMSECFGITVRRKKDLNLVPTPYRHFTC